MRSCSWYTSSTSLRERFWGNSHSRCCSAALKRQSVSTTRHGMPWRTVRTRYGVWTRTRHSAGSSISGFTHRSSRKERKGNHDKYRNHMKILTRKGILRTELFKEIVLHERLGLISLCYCYRYEEDGEQATEFQVQVPLTFRTRKQAREAFRTYLRARNKGLDSVSLLGFRCSWPRKTYRKIMDHKKQSLLEL